MASALVQVCTDFRLNHELIRIQVKQRLSRAGVNADRVYILNEVGGNPGHNLTNMVELLKRAGEPIVFCAILHHDDCLAARYGLRHELTSASHEFEGDLGRLGVHCPVVTGEIRTQDNRLQWSDEPVIRFLPFTFGPGWR